MSADLVVLDVAVICGPTAAGKSRVAMALAAETGAQVLSADSRQIYQHFDIGTAKPSRADRERVVHHGIDIVSPVTRYSAAEWQVLACALLHAAQASCTPVIVVGGTGFYLRTLETPLFESPVLDATARTAALAELEPLSTEALRERCTRVDPARADLGRTQLLRALETWMITGRPLSAWMIERARPAEFRPHYLVVDPGVRLQAQIQERLAKMLAAGWEDEVATLTAAVPSDAPAWNACGYSALRDLHDGVMTRAAALERVNIDTRQYAKRQRTWFRHQLPAERTQRLDPHEPDAIARALHWFSLAAPLEHM